MNINNREKSNLRILLVNLPGFYQQRSYLIIYSIFITVRVSLTTLWTTYNSVQNNANFTLFVVLELKFSLISVLFHRKLYSKFGANINLSRKLTLT